MVLVIPNITKDYEETLLEFVDDNVKLVLIRKPKHRMYNPAYHFHYLLLIFSIIQKIKSLNPEVIHIQVGSSFGMYFISSFLKKHYPIVLTVHDPKIHVGQCWYRSAKFLQKYILSNANYVLVHGSYLKKQLVEIYNFPDNNVFEIPMGAHEILPFKKFERIDCKEEENTILFFGTITEYKGLDYLIKAEPIITKEVPDAKIIIAGAGIKFERYLKLMKNKKNFRIYNYFIPYQLGAELLQKCSIIVLPYIEASQSGVIPTAYGFRKPIIATSVGSIPEIIEDGKTGLIVPPKDIDALANSIIKLLKDKKLRDQIGMNGQEKLVKDLSWAKIADKTIHVYEEAIKDANS